MTKDERNEFKKLFIEALNSKEGQNAIISALKSKEAKEIIKQATLEALRSKEAEEILSDYFDKAFKDVAMPAFNKMHDDIEELKENSKIIREDIDVLRMDVSYLKESAVKRDKFIYDMREKMLSKIA